MIKNIILDFGNVICRFDPDEILTHFISDKADIPLAKRLIFDRWHSLDSGKTDYDKYISRVLSLMPERLCEGTSAFFANWYKTLEYVDGVREFVAKQKLSGYKLFVLSDAPQFFSVHRNYFDIFKSFNGLVFSGDEKVTKPDPKIYKILLERYSINPGESLFIDDLQKNIDGAKACGIHGLRFDGDFARIERFLSAV